MRTTIEDHTETLDERWEFVGDVSITWQEDFDGSGRPFADIVDVDIRNGSFTDLNDGSIVSGLAEANLYTYLLEILWDKADELLTLNPEPDDYNDGYNPNDDITDGFFDDVVEGEF